MRKTILLCEDDQDIAYTIRKTLESSGYLVTLTISGTDCLRNYRPDFDLVLLDIQLPEINGCELLKRIKEQNSKQKILMMTAYSSIEQAVSVMKLGAENYIRKPFDGKYLIAAVEEAIGKSSKSSLSGAEDSALPSYMLNSKSPAMNKLFETIERVASKNVSVIINGESGTGKEMIAQLIHKQSSRSKSHVVAVNCPAIPDNLVESTLFGHEKGSFTGASEKRIGKFEQADKGTLFLDEVAELNLEVQSKLLRVLQEREIEPIGSKKPKAVDIRLICASCKTLREEVENDSFRMDLLYRLADVELTVPPLRERVEDIPELVQFFASVYANENDMPTPHFSEDAVNKLKTYYWPGNIRELKSIVRRILIMSNSSSITAEDINDDYFVLSNIAQQERSVENVVNLHSRKRSIEPDNYNSSAKSLEENEIELIVDALNSCNFNVTRAAQQLNIGRATLYRKIKKYNIRGRA